MAGNETPSDRPESQSAPPDRSKPTRAAAGRSALDFIDELESYLKQVKGEQVSRPDTQSKRAQAAPPAQAACQRSRGGHVVRRAPT